VYQGGGGSEADRQPTLTCRKTETESDMSLAGPAVAEGDDGENLVNSKVVGCDYHHDAA
jgi:hypothetical protein